MDAKISETVTGFKSLLLKMIDPLFSGENGGSEIPIRISGPAGTSLPSASTRDGSSKKEIE